tara:strand:- start:13 stop:1251 length:1239 start_codon:yes stop_codon:yes gene_type:complete
LAENKGKIKKRLKLGFNCYSKKNVHNRVMERVFSKLERRGRMSKTTNTALKNIDTNIANAENIKPISVGNLKTFEKIKSLLDKNEENINSDLSTRGQLLIECSLITLDESYNIYIPKVNDKFKISNSELDKWVESVFDGGLFDVYKITFENFKLKFSSHFNALKDIASAVSFFIGNFHNAETSANAIPFCKVGKASANALTSDMVAYSIEGEGAENEEFTLNDSGEFFENNRLYVRLNFLHNLENSDEYPIKNRVMTEGNGFSADMIKGINRGQTTYSDFSINQIISMSNPIINYHKFVSKGEDTEKSATANSLTGLTNTMNDADEKSSSVLNSSDQKKLVNLADTYFSNSLVCNNNEGDFKGIMQVLEKIGKALENNKKLIEYFRKNQFAFIARKYNDGGLYNSIADTIYK